jgi:hypothetical protein
MVDIHFLMIGIGEKALASASETREQIDKIKALDCGLQVGGRSLNWHLFDNPRDPRALFQRILKDREMRVDWKAPLPNRPPFCVVTVMDDKAVRLEFYEGSAQLKLEYDIRSEELEGTGLPNYMKEDRPEATETLYDFFKRHDPF